MEKVLVTGANGYIGRHVINALLKYTNFDIVAADLHEGSFDSNRVKSVGFNILKDAKNPELYSMLGKPEIVIHLAWRDGFNHNAASHLEDLNAHFEFLKNIVDGGCKSVSVMGTMHEVGYFEGEINADTPCKPLSLYGIAKNALRQAALFYTTDKNVSLKWLRAYYITGDDLKSKSIFGKIMQMAQDGKESFPFTTGLNKYDFIDVDELARQIVFASVQNEIEGIINCCSGQPVSLKDKVQEFIKSHGLNIQPEYGVYPSRKYDSPAIWGNADLINKIMERQCENV